MTNYDYDEFDGELSALVRREAYGDDDIGQHSWVTASELDAAALTDPDWLALTAGDRLLDVGCGPCGPLTRLALRAGCRASGVDVSAAALAAGRRRAERLGVGDLIALHLADVNAAPLADFADGAFTAVLALDVVLHLRDRAAFYAETARLLAPGGRLLLTDAAVLGGAVSSDDVALRSVHGYTQICCAGYNERTASSCGLTLLRTRDATASLLATAGGRLRARAAHSAQLVEREGRAQFDRQQAYLAAVCRLASSATLTRQVYLFVKAS